jgi:DNA-binding NtrC family response regulator
LRDRVEDIQRLSQHFVRHFCARDGHEEMRFADEAASLLTIYEWPGNVRELQNICERAVVLNANAATSRRDIPASLIAPWIGASQERAAPVVTPSAQRFVESAPSAGPRRLEEIEREVIVQTLVQFNGHRQKTAKALGIGVRTLGLKLKKWKELHLVAQTL